MAKYAELEACVCVSVRGEIEGGSRMVKNEAAGENAVSGDECQKSTDIEKKGVTV